ncbi:ASKHA domain-containing protein [Oscillospiraceae bacterium PP1C4]
MMQMITVHVESAIHELPYSTPVLLADVLERLQISLSMPCAGNHTCGKCKVRAYGSLFPLLEEEKRLLSIEEQLGNVRLACCAIATGGCMVYVDLPKSVLVQTEGRSVRRDDISPFGKSGWALAADIGTTTVAVYLIDLSKSDTDKPPAVSGLNAQARYGADVISRIAKCAEIGIKPLQDAILYQLDGLFCDLLHKRGLPEKAVKGVVLTGNTTMLHLLSGLDPSGIAAAPFIPQSLFGVMYDARRLFACLPPATPVYLAPCISAYVGGDIVCSLLTCDLKQNDLLIDVGTNGEMALMTESGLLCCSTAAGPAFEGAGLQCGMLAADGAINVVAAVDGHIHYKAVGDAPPIGICGTGIISAVAAMLELGAIDETGLLADEYNGVFPIGDSGVVITQQDVRQIQLAKSAVAAGIDALLYHAKLEYAQVGTLYLAGGFGSCIDPESAARIGLIPRELSERVTHAGNAAGLGACLCASSESALEDADTLSKAAQTLELSGDAYFNERYIEQMLFP